MRGQAIASIETADQFEQRVKFDQRAVKAAQAVIWLAALLVARNLYVTSGSLKKNPGVSFGELFFSPTDDYGRFSAFGATLIWGPFVLLPVAFGLLVIGRATRRRVAQRVFDDYTRYGWVAEQVPSNVTVRLPGAKRVPLVFLTDPTVSRGQLESVVQQIAQRLASDPADATTAAQQASRIAAKGARAATLFPEAPPSTFAIAQRAAGRPIVVMDDPGHGLRVYDLKKRG